MKLGNASNCCGCTVCKEICPKKAIEMIQDSHGFAAPRINDNCIECGLCERMCPLISEKRETGANRESYVLKRKDDQLRRLSQSGGAFSVFAEGVLGQKGVIYGALVDKNMDVVYARVDSIKRLQGLRGSKYVQADVKNVYSLVRNDLLRNQLVLFSGTPCHVHGLYNYLQAKKVCTERLYTVDIICHGVVSPLVYQDYRAYFERIHRTKIRAFNFRDKQFGWRRVAVSIKAGLNKYISGDYVKIFHSDLPLRDCCYECKFANLSRVGDVTVGDCWGIEHCNKEFDDGKGCSLLLVNTDKGRWLFRENKNQFHYLSVSIEKMLQPNLIRPTPKPSKTDDFWFDYQTYGFEYAAFKYCNINPNMDYIQNDNYLKRLMRRLRFRS